MSKGLGETRRYIECSIFVLVWMAAGSLFKLGGSGYLLLGVPLVVAFQLLIARRPLRQLWARDPGSFRMDFKTLLMALTLISVPVLALFFQVRQYGSMLVVIAVGAIPCAFALRHQHVAKLRHAFPSFGMAIVVGCAVFASFAIWDGRSPGMGLAKLPIFFTDVVCLTLAGFVVEEVVFRGALDSHLVPAQGTSFQPWVSAIFVSFLWGIWHLPLTFLYPSREVGFLALAIFINILWGVPLSFCWRKSGTLLLPSVVHALCDSYRNALM
ncbi:MAG: CPBP family intramembrane metalloprotease [Opitutae bacterium]|nr:CPBP family intramembrane metalloprotease [Opitutae bacterium]